MGFYNNTSSGSNTYEGKTIKWMDEILNSEIGGLLTFDLQVVYNYDTNLIEIYCTSTIQACELYRILSQDQRFLGVNMTVLKVPLEKYPQHNCVIELDPSAEKDRIMKL